MYGAVEYTVNSRNIARVQKSAGSVLTPSCTLNEINKCHVCLTFEMTYIDAGAILTPVKNDV